MIDTGKKVRQKLKQDYVGGVDYETKLRHGEGTYTYQNRFFQYTGDWEYGAKHGKGKLIMADGGYYDGDFFNG